MANELFKCSHPNHIYPLVFQKSPYFAFNSMKITYLLFLLLLYIYCAQNHSQAQSINEHIIRFCHALIQNLQPNFTPTKEYIPNDENTLTLLNTHIVNILHYGSVIILKKNIYSPGENISSYKTKNADVFFIEACTSIRTYSSDDLNSLSQTISDRYRIQLKTSKNSLNRTFSLKRTKSTKSSKNKDLTIRNDNFINIFKEFERVYQSTSH